MYGDRFESILEYNLFKSTDPLEFNMDRVETDRMIFITGYSGSGKTTLTEKIKQDYNNCISVSLDYLYTIIKFITMDHNNEEISEYKRETWLTEEGRRKKAGNILTDYTLAHEDEYYTPAGYNIWKDKNHIMSKYVRDFIMYMIDTYRYGSNIIIIEGVQIYMFDTADLIAGLPVIINGTSLTESTKRKFKRDYDLKHMSKQDYKRMIAFFSGINNDAKAMDIFVKHMKEIDDVRVS